MICNRLDHATMGLELTLFKTQILQLQPGDPIRSGVINVGMTNNAKIGQAGDDVQVLLGTQDSFYSGIAPNVDLILAMPRPQKLEKLLPIISCLGVRRIFLVGANKVELDYFGKCSLSLHSPTSRCSRA